MDLLYVEEHQACKNYVSDFHIGFNYKELEKDSTLHIEDKYYNYLLFLLEGEIVVSYNEFTNQPCSGGEMIFISQDMDFTGKTFTQVRYILLSFDNQFTLCDQIALESLTPYSSQEESFHRLPIREPMKEVLKSVHFYLTHKIQCKHLHEAKQKEVFLVLKAFYTKQELAVFLSPIINKNMDFKAFILRNYQNVKTVEELAKLCNSSVRSLTRKFRTYFGDSPYSWMLKQRSRHIRNRLTDVNIPIGQIIKEFGFSSPAHFTSYCKKYYGMGPSKLRKEMKNNP